MLIMLTAVHRDNVRHLCINLAILKKVRSLLGDIGQVYVIFDHKAICVSYHLCYLLSFGKNSASLFACLFAFVYFS